ncbi:DUF3795 domain-containing protein [Chloroflexota bacterium]
MVNKMREELIAPCGINCGVCKSYLAKKRGLYKSKSSGCAGCIPRNRGCGIKRDCEKFRKNNFRFCYECSDFPCKVIGRLEKKYTTKYHTSLINNLMRIQNRGMNQWLASEKTKWKCPECGGIVSMHTATCYDCGSDSWNK